jgi:hypothetical protein
MPDLMPACIRHFSGESPDPGLAKYFQWLWSYFPIELPACTVEMSQTPAASNGAATLTWTMDKGLPLLMRVDDSEGRVWAEVIPAASSNGSGGSPDFHVRYDIPEALLGGEIGFGFVWAFFVELLSYVPQHPMGIVKVHGSQLAGKVTSFVIRDTRPPKPEGSDT